MILPVECSETGQKHMNKRFGFELARKAASVTTAGLLTFSTLAYGQQTSVPNAGTNGWPTVTQGDAPPAPGDAPTAQNDEQAQASGQATAPQAQGQQQPPAEQPPYDAPQQAPQPQWRRPMPPPNGGGYGQTQNGPYAGAPGNGSYEPPQNYRQQPPPPIPAQLTVPSGAFVTVRLNQRLASDKNQKGDSFTATLVQPVVANGVVVAEPGETLGGVVADAQRSGSTQKLVVQLTDLTLSDGQRIPLQTQLIARHGTGRNAGDAGTIIGTTALGAAVGGIVGWGTGAAIGAGAGLVVGALVTHDHPSVLYPEQVLTFQVQTPLTISTVNAPQAFHYVEPGEYDRAPYNGPSLQQREQVYVGPGYYPYWGYPYLGTGIGFYAFGGPRYYYPGRFYGGGYYRGRVGYARGGSFRR